MNAAKENMKIRKAHYWNHLLHLKSGIECILTLKKLQTSSLSTLIISNWEVDAMCYISSPSRGLGKVQQEKCFFYGGGHHSCPSQQSPHSVKIVFNLNFIRRNKRGSKNLQEGTRPINNKQKRSKCWKDQTILLE